MEEIEENGNKKDISNTGGQGIDDSFEDWKGSKIRNCRDLIYKITVSNTRSEPIQYKVQMSDSNPGSTINLHWPRSGVKGTLDVGEMEIACVLQKIEPSDNTGISEIEKLKIELKWKVNEQRLKQIAQM